VFISKKLFKGESKPTITPFILDEPLFKNGVDELERRDDANDLVRKILATTSEKSIAIGINGEWGSGKTSFIQMMKDELAKKKEAVIIDFNPWRGYKENALYRDFFLALSEEVGKHGDLLKMDLKRYGDTLTSTKESFLDSVVSFGTNLFDVDSIEGQHKEINDILKKLNKTFIVFVDDLDRLSSPEIVDIIKLVRNTADFFNLKFVLAYDRNYLLSALKRLNDYNYETYLEKVILFEHSLLPISETHIKKALRSLFSQYIVEQAQDDFKKITAVVNFERGAHILRFVFNLRDVKRLCNKVIPLFNERYKEVDAVDFVNFELLRFRYPAIARLILNRRPEFMKVSNDGIMSLQPVEDKKNEYVLLNYLEGNLLYYQIESANKEKIFNLLSALFITDQILDALIPDKSIKRFKNFDAYFRESAPENAISHEEFETLLSASLGDLKSALVQLVKNKKRWSVVEKFSNFSPLKSCKNTNEFEKVIRAIFYLGNIPAVAGEELHGYPDKDMFEKLYTTDAIVTKFYDGNKELFHTFFIDLLDSSAFPYFNEAGFLSYLSDSNFSDDFIISQDEIEKYLLMYFQNYCNKQEVFDRMFWRLYHNCIKRIKIDAHHTQKVPIEAAKIIHIEFSLKNMDILKSYLRNVIGKEIWEGKVFRINEIIPKVHGSYQAFADRLKSSKYVSEPVVQEFLEFHEKFKATSYQQHVPFEFKYIFDHQDQILAA